MTLRPHALALAAALAASPAYAVSLGQVQMQSGLGQPLLATVPVYDADAEDLRSLDVRLASDDAFRRLGLERGQYQDIQIRLLFDDGGRPLLQLSSERPFNEPVFNLLLDANWRDGGRLVKEVTALVDPPFIARTAVQTIDAPTVELTPVVAAPVPSAPPRTPAIPTGSRPEAREPAPATPEKPPVAAKPRPRPAQSAASAPPRISAIPATADNQREVRTGETLYAIAAERRGQLADSRISLNQMMAAIQRANPEAFIRGDANRLKRGSVLRLPDERQTRALLPEDSANLLNSQWARKVQAQPPPVLDAANRLGRGADSSPARKPAGAAPNNQGRLKIVPTVGNMNTAGSQSGASRSGQGNELRSENAAGAEEIAARQVEIANLRKQLDEAAKLQTESKRLIELQNSQIKQLTERMQQIEKGAPASPVAAGAQPAVEAAAPWYASPFVSVAGLLLIAGLAGALLIRRRR